MKAYWSKNFAILISVIFLILAAVGLFQYGFYTLLRFIVFVTTTYLAWLAYSNQKQQWTWLFGFIAVLFNPFIPIHFSRDLWRVIDLVVAVFLIVSIFAFRLTKR